MHTQLRRIVILLLTAAIVAATPLAVSAQHGSPDVPVASEMAEAVEMPVPEPPRLPDRRTESDGSMETALIAAKTLLNIDDDVFTDFSYSSTF